MKPAFLLQFISRCKTFTSHVIQAAPLDVVTATSANNGLCLLTFTRIAMTLSAGVPPPGCYKTSVRYDIKCKYKHLNHYFEVSSSDEKH